ncbi:uncharacterized protein LOC111343455 [Stylophora pistillata]|uniref:uncharacterized protein LOC111343455 n=1 Tax=Stylophora pistillata TaxID=50429 RepID=UPI000C056518|nr:uncharacterized protein LOC111343455 [Stylophora pistillata]
MRSYRSGVLLFLAFAMIVFLWQFQRKNSAQRVTLEPPTYVRMSRESTLIPEKKTSIETEPLLIIFWTTVFGIAPHYELVYYNGSDCPVACQVTSDRSRAREADGFVVHGWDADMIPPNGSVPWIFFTQENPVYVPKMKDAKFMSKFNLLMSYRLDYDIPVPVVPMPQLTPPLPFKEKTKLIMAAFSNCEAVRTEYMRQLMNFVQVDSYGACLRNKNDLVSRGGSKNGKNFKELKSELARQYKFLLVFFNEDCDYFVDDQLIHALNAGAVPVVMSTDKLDEFLPGNLKLSVIKVRDFKTPKDLSDYLKFLSTNETEYNKYLTWKSEGIGNFTGTAIGNVWKPKYPIYCQLCMALSEGRIHEEGLAPIPCLSCTTQLLQVLHELGQTLDSGLETDVIYLDFSKAFDSVCHAKLLSKLRKFGIDGLLPDWFSSYLIGRQQRVVVNVSFSTWSIVKSGVPQGSILGPVLFLMFENDMPNVLKSSSLAMYADYSKCFKTIKAASDICDFQDDLNLLCNWSSLNELYFQPIKCHNLKISRKKTSLQRIYNLNNTAINLVTKERDLGLTVTKDLTWNQHIIQTVSKANKLLGFIKRNCHTIQNEKTLTLLYSSLIRSHFSFASQVWAPQS